MTKTTKNNYNLKAISLKIEGLVQSVGFRPFIYRHALKHHLYGFVLNQSDGVVIHVEGNGNNISHFLETLREEAPQAAKIERIIQENAVIKGYQDFTIAPSLTIENVITGISPDICVCDKCLEDLKTQKRRLNYPFINCTNCGPRFTIIRDFPYDRPKTTMSEFEMCADCRQEYENVNDRRFHAQPIACNNCGPEYVLTSNNEIITDFNLIIAKISKLISSGKILAVKGLGGYHMACDAFNETAVERLRKIKLRDGKPFALLFRNLEIVKKYCKISATEEELLTSWQRPIVLINNLVENSFPSGITNGLSTLGAFLPYLPFHYILFNALITDVIVLTSCNISDTPIFIDNKQVLKVFSDKADAIVTNNRDIYNRADDSVIREINSQKQFIRRSRGYVPTPINLKINSDGILATGAELSNCFCIGKEKQAIMSQHIGDLKNYETYEFFEQTIDLFKKLFRFKPELVAADMHPDYLSTQYAENSGVEILKVQHHHAHCLSVIAEHKLDRPVIGVSFDGTGYGTDHHIWGSEFLVLDGIKFDRKYHFEYQPIPGGDLASKQAWRSGLSYLVAAYKDDYLDVAVNRLTRIEKSTIIQTKETIERNINSPMSCSAGRLFDAVAAITGICQESTFHSEAPMQLESLTYGTNTDDYYEFEISNVISFASVIRQIVIDINNKINNRIISAKFHNTVAHIIFETIKTIQKETGINSVVLSGGSFQNKFLTEKLLALNHRKKLRFYLPGKVPANDGGIALGELYYAAKSRELCV